MKSNYKEDTIFLELLNVRLRNKNCIDPPWMNLDGSFWDHARDPREHPTAGPLIKKLDAILAAHDANIKNIRKIHETLIAGKYTQIPLQSSDGRIHFLTINHKDTPSLTYHHTSFPSIYAEFFGDPNKTIQEEVLRFLKDYRGEEKGDVAEFRKNPFYFFSLKNRHYKTEATTLIYEIGNLKKDDHYTVLELETILLNMRSTIVQKRNPLDSHFIRRIDYALMKVQEQFPEARPEARSEFYIGKGLN